MMKALKKIIIFITLSTLCSCGYVSENNSSKKVKEIEELLGIPESNLKNSDRLGYIAEVLRRREELTSVVVFANENSIRKGDTFQGLIIPVRVYPEDSIVGASISLNDSTWGIKGNLHDYPGIFINTSKYQIGPNEINGTLMLNRDTIDFRYHFKVSDFE